MTTVHINWTSCNDWHATRAKIRRIYRAAALYGNFGDIADAPEDVKQKLETAGFVVRDDSQKPAASEAARFRVSDGTL